MFTTTTKQPPKPKRALTVAFAAFVVAIIAPSLMRGTQSVSAGDQNAVTPQVWGPASGKKISEIEFSPRVLGKGWKLNPGVRFDDLENTKDLPDERQVVAASLARQLSPVGVRAVGDFTLVRSKPMNTVTVRVFIFEDAERCRAWWQKKYEYDGWNEHYTLVNSDRALCVDSRQMNKRAMAFGNVWLTAHQLGVDDEHIVAIEHIAAQLTTQVGGSRE